MYQKSFKRVVAPVAVMSAMFSSLVGQSYANFQKPIKGPYIEPYFGCTVDDDFMMNFVYGALNRLETHFGINLSSDFDQKPSRIATMLPGFMCAYKAGANCVLYSTQAYVDGVMGNPTEYVFEFTRQQLLQVAVSNHQDCVDYARTHQIAYENMRLVP